MLRYIIPALFRIIANSNKMLYANSAIKRLTKISKKDPKTFKRLKKALEQIEKDPKYSGLQTHEFRQKTGPNNEKILRSVTGYSGAAWRIHWYMPKDMTNTIMILEIIPHE
jgi:hypothetical protein